jgi:pimeloyl-ACP methyl ester carboxylesterase
MWIYLARAEAYRRDVPDAEVHLLDAGHFALDEQPDRIAELTGAPHCPDNYPMEQVIGD